MTTVVPTGPRNSVGLDRGFRSAAVLRVMVAFPFVTDELEGGIDVVKPSRAEGCIRCRGELCPVSDYLTIRVCRVDGRCRKR